ncbi:hypothetical protein, partial [Klebsiella pneumoniae]|uniref:hypothetical protein n=1 Tax=Klebsiella pneumoniae TaxID=573 RepID=UPI0024DE3560
VILKMPIPISFPKKLSNALDTIEILIGHHMSITWQLGNCVGVSEYECFTLQEFGGQVVLNINIKKTKEMRIGVGGQEVLELNGEAVERVSEF